MIIKVDEISFEVADNYKICEWCPNGFFQDQFLNGWEKDTLRVIKSFASSSKILIDVGAWIGPITLYGSKLYKRVISFEPDPVALKYLKKNLSLLKSNGKPQSENVTLFEKGLMACTSSEGQLFGGSKDLGNSETTFLCGYDFFRNTVGHDLQRGSYEDRTSNLIKVPTITLEDSLIDADVNPCDVGLMKIDIEGGEYLLISHLKSFLEKHNIPLLISIHYCFLPREYALSVIKTLFHIYNVVKDPHTDVEVCYNQAKKYYLTDFLCIKK